MKAIGCLIHFPASAPRCLRLCATNAALWDARKKRSMSRSPKSEWLIFMPDDCPIARSINRSINLRAMIRQARFQRNGSASGKKHDLHHEEHEEHEEKED